MKGGILMNQETTPEQKEEAPELQIPGLEKEKSEKLAQLLQVYQQQEELVQDKTFRYHLLLTIENLTETLKTSLKTTNEQLNSISQQLYDLNLLLKEREGKEEKNE